MKFYLITTPSANFTSLLRCRLAAIASGLIMLLGATCPLPAQTEILTNSGFEDGSLGWTVSLGFHADSRFSFPHNGSGYAYLSESDGSPGNNLVGILYQIFTIPSSASSASLEFWYNITTQEAPGGSAFDFLNVTVQSDSGEFLETIAFLSNLDSQSAAGLYQRHFLNLSPYVGQTIRINFLGTTDSSLPTTFRVDDVSVQAVLTDPPRSFTLTNESPVCDTDPPGPSPAIRLIWTSSNGATSYKLYRNGSVYDPNIPATETSFYNSDNVNEGQTYTYFVRALNSAGGRDSNTVTVMIPSDICGPDIRIEPLTLNFTPSPQATFESIKRQRAGNEVVVLAAEEVNPIVLSSLADDLSIGGTLLIEGVSLERGYPEESIELERFEVFASDARIVVHGRYTDEVLAPPSNIYFRGRIEDDSRSLAFLTVRADGGSRGLVTSGGRYWVLESGEPVIGTVSGLDIREIDAQTEYAEFTSAFDCDVEELHDPLDLPKTQISRALNTLLTRVVRKGAPMHTARIAIETDWEFYQLFGNTSDAVDYIGDLIGFNSGIYAAEIDTDFVISHVSLWSSGNDPWNELLSSCALFEFGRYWNDNNGALDRTIAHFLSGKNTGGGIAWEGALCLGALSYDHEGLCPNLAPQIDDYFGAYGFSGILNGGFDLNNPSVVWDIFVVGHEIGHNFNSPHSHCYADIGGNANPVDECSAAQCGVSGCFCGSPSLPCATEGAGCGTIMSYCHRLSGGLGNISLTLGTDDPFGTTSERIPSRMRDHVLAAAASNPNCLIAAGGASQEFTIFNDGSGVLSVDPIALETTGSWISWSPETSFIVPAGGSRTVTLSIDFGSAPAAQSTRRLLVSSTDPDESPYPGGVFINVNMGQEACHALTLTHTGQGTEPLASPLSSTGCPIGYYHSEEPITLTASPAFGWILDSWVGTENDGSTSTNNSVTMPPGDHTITVNYVEDTATCYALTVTNTGQGTDPTTSPPSSTGCPSGYFYSNERIILNASPASGWHVDSWIGTDNDNSTSTSNSATMPLGNHTVIVNYAEDTVTCFALTLMHTGQGTDPTASPSSFPNCTTGQYHVGETIILAASPDALWSIGSWVGTINNASTAAINTASMPDGNHTVSVNYIPDPSPCNVSTHGVLAFDSKLDFTIGTAPLGVGAADFDGDGLIDLAVTAHEDDKLVLLRNVSQADSIDFALDAVVAAGLHPQGIAVADLDGDGLPDIVSADSGRGGGGTLSVYQNTSNLGEISFLRALEPSVDTAHRAAIADFNLDGKPDIVVSQNSGGALHVFPNASNPGTIALGQRTILGGPAPLNSVAAGDLDGDGRKDIVMTVGNLDTIWIFPNTTIPGTAVLSFGVQIVFNTGDGPDGIDIADLNGDGRVDILAANVLSNTFSVFLNQTASAGVALARSDFSAGNRPRSVIVADFDTDGLADVAITNSDDHLVSILLNRTVGETPSFEVLETGLETGLSPVLLAAGQLDDDELWDVVTSNHEDTTISVFRNDWQPCVGDDDTDSDGVCDASDNCPADANCDQADGDGDSVGDVCDFCAGDDSTGDTDNDGVCDDLDVCVGNDDTGDSDTDGTCNDLDVCFGFNDGADTDGDGVPDGCDLCPGFDDAADGDEDGVPDGCDLCLGMDTSGDLDEDGVCDDLDSCEGDDATGDMDGDGVCANSDCDDDDPAVALIGPCGVCGGDGTTCPIFTDGFEFGDTSAWSRTSS